jgi:uncharacterized protein YqjF (DUF2071 family)
VLELALYEELRRRPEGRPLMRHTWLDLAFLHFSVEPEVVQRTLPPGLIADTYPDADGREKAWIGFVPFRMEGVKFERLLPIPGCNAFPETNIRTYVHWEGRAPGIWFYSLDASNPIGCAAARMTFGLPYVAARMLCRRQNDDVRYRSRRWRTGGGADGRAKLGAPRPLAEPGTLEFFLIERYVLYSWHWRRLVTAQVHHHPYPLRDMQWQGAESLTTAAGFDPLPWQHQIFSEGLRVEVFPLRPCDGSEPCQ